MNENKSSGIYLKGWILHRGFIPEGMVLRVFVNGISLVSSRIPELSEGKIERKNSVVELKHRFILHMFPLNPLNVIFYVVFYY